VAAPAVGTPAPSTEAAARQQAQQQAQVALQAQQAQQQAQQAQQAQQVQQQVQQQAQQQELSLFGLLLQACISQGGVAAGFTPQLSGAFLAVLESLPPAERAVKVRKAGASSMLRVSVADVMHSHAWTVLSKASSSDDECGRLLLLAWGADQRLPWEAGEAPYAPALPALPCTAGLHYCPKLLSHGRMQWLLCKPPSAQCLPASCRPGCLQEACLRELLAAGQYQAAAWLMSNSLSPFLGLTSGPAGGHR